MSEVNTRVLAPANGPKELKGTPGAVQSGCPLFTPDLRPAAKTHQGMIFLRPFFFLLLDSFLLSPLVPFPSGAVEPSVLAVSEV